jgi:uncharacterized membrane protein YgdD (TMEM256/DUF423 family)
MSGTFWIKGGALSAGLAVAAGAFGAHALEGKLEPRAQAVFETAARYQMYHALALMIVGLLASSRAHSGKALSVAGWAFAIGTVLFSGSLFGLALSGIRWLGAITPLGGVAFLVGWLALAFVRKDREKSDATEDLS